MVNINDPDFDPLLQQVDENSGRGIGFTIFIVFLVCLFVYYHVARFRRRQFHHNHEAIVKFINDVETLFADFDLNEI